jgi:hypothetical protein
MYSVGELKNPQPTDRRFATPLQAELAAREESWPDRILGIWDDEDGELIAIAYDGGIYRP